MVLYPSKPCVGLFKLNVPGRTSFFFSFVSYHLHLVVPSYNDKFKTPQNNESVLVMLLGWCRSCCKNKVSCLIARQNFLPSPNYFIKQHEIIIRSLSLSLSKFTAFLFSSLFALAPIEYYKIIMLESSCSDLLSPSSFCSSSFSKDGKL